MNKLNARIALVVGALAFSSAQADVLLNDCNGCSTAQVEAMAPPCGLGHAYVSDLVSQNLYKVCFDWDVDDGQRPPVKYKDYTWATPEASVQQTWQAYKNVYLNNGHVEAADVKVTVNIPTKTPLHGDNGRMNAYDTVGATANNDAVVDYLNTTYFTSSSVDGAIIPASPALRAALAAMLNAIQVTTPFITLNPSYPINVVVVFSDGSQRTYAYSYTAQKFQAVSGTARDGHGQLIPENQAMASNDGGTETYNHTGNGPGYDQPNLQNLLNQFGAKIVNGGGGFTTCSWRPDTNTLTCTIHPY